MHQRSFLLFLLALITPALLVGCKLSEPPKRRAAEEAPQPTQGEPAAVVPEQTKDDAPPAPHVDPMLRQNVRGNIGQRTLEPSPHRLRGRGGLAPSIKGRKGPLELRSKHGLDKPRRGVPAPPESDPPQSPLDSVGEKVDEGKSAAPTTPETAPERNIEAPVIPEAESAAAPKP